MKILNLHLTFVAILGTFILLSSCSTYQQFQRLMEEADVPTEIIEGNYPAVWQAALKVLNFPMIIKDEDTGIIKTDWVDNTREVNFSDSFGSSDAIKGARYKLIVNLVAGNMGNKEFTKIRILRRQFIEHDFLQGWKEIPTDGILEKTLLYRIKRLVQIDTTLKELERKKQEKELNSF